MNLHLSSHQRSALRWAGGAMQEAHPKPVTLNSLERRGLLSIDVKEHLLVVRLTEEGKRQCS